MGLLLMAHVIKENIEKILSLDGNDKCSDCGIDIDKNNGWSSITFGVIICVECAGIHRGIAGNQIRSFLLDSKAWKDNKNVNFLSKINGNNRAKSIWECHLPNFYINPHFDDINKLENKKKMAQFRTLCIKNKYEKQLFVKLPNKDKYTKKNPSIIKVPIDPPKQI